MKDTIRTRPLSLSLEEFRESLAWLTDATLGGGEPEGADAAGAALLCALREAAGEACPAECPRCRGES